MGQYYFPMSLDKKQWIYTWDYDNGLKLMEHSYLANYFVQTVENLLIEGGDWYRTRIVWSGDYADEYNFMTKEEKKLCKKYGVKLGFENGMNLHHLCVEDDDDEKPNLKKSPLKKILINKIFPSGKKIDKSYRYIVNHTQKEYVDKKKCKNDVNNFGYKIHPLPLLTCDGNGRGGGDFRGEDESFIGIWAGHVISIEKEIPKGYTEIIPNFKEE
jgi:hypothetical protein